MTVESSNESPREILATGALEFGITLTEIQLDMFDAYTRLLVEWNEKLNLTRIIEPREIAIKHYLDSLSVLSAVKMNGNKSVIDIGTGAGFPGIPLKIVYPELTLTLLDSVNKRLLFIVEAAKELGFNDVLTLHARAEDAGRNRKHRERYDFALSRAVGKLGILAELCVPFCKPNGRFVAYKGPDAGAEVREGLAAIKLLGGKIDKVQALTLPGTDMQRTLVVVKKIIHTPMIYPRKAGIPEREPLV